MRLDSDLKHVKLLSSWFQASTCAQRIALWDELVMSLEDHLGIPCCEIGAPVMWKLKMKKLCSQTNDFLCYSVTAGSPFKAHSQLKRRGDLSASVIKIFGAHLIVMGLVKKNKCGKTLENQLLDEDTILWQHIVKKYLPEYSNEHAHSRK